MKDLNEVKLIGVVHKQPTSGFTKNNKPVTNFIVKTSRHNKDNKDCIEFHSVSAYSHLAEIAKKYLAQGSRVYISGEIRTEKKLKNNIEHEFKKILATHLIALDSPKKEMCGNTFHAIVIDEDLYENSYGL